MAADPRVLTTPSGCCCRCHAAGLANRLAGVVDEDPITWARGSAMRNDIVAAASACPRCADNHCPALSGTPPELLTRRRTATPGVALVAVPSGPWRDDATGEGAEA